MTLRLAYYGDDFTGSTDVMEALARAGYRTVLFLEPPNSAALAAFPGLQAFGIAGGSRAFSPAEMTRGLPPVFEALKASGAPIVHYKMCSTFDSSPTTGSIGTAIEVGRRVFGERPTPLVIGAPVLGRYVVFGNLFARSGLDSEPVRLDRHPTMSRHPITPMDEADVRLHLGKQTTLPLELVDVLKLESGHHAWPASGGSDRTAPVVVFDTLTEAHLPVIGQAIASLAEHGQLFVVGSSGVEYALIAHWRTQGTREPVPAPVQVGPVSHIIAVSGSCSPVTGRQIERALAAGFADVPLDPRRLSTAAEAEASRRAAVAAARRLLSEGRSVILHTSLGPADPRTRAGAGATGDLSERLGSALAVILDELLDATGLRRAVVCGGDTSTHVARGLGIEALEFLAPAAPGSPLCRVHAPARVADGCDIVFKGGQVGRDVFFLDVLNGTHLP